MTTIFELTSHVVHKLFESKRATSNAARVNSTSEQNCHPYRATRSVEFVPKTLLKHVGNSMLDVVCSTINLLWAPGALTQV